MTVPKHIQDQYGFPGDWVILSGWRGSIAHGMWSDPSDDPNSIDDKDVMSVVVPPLDYYFGYPEASPANQMFSVKGTREIKRDEWDIVVYELRKFVRLLAQGNPNVLSLLWLQPNHYLKVTDASKILLDSRNVFVGRHVYRSFVGYAHSQLSRMTRFEHNGYMGQRRKELVEKYGFDTKNASHLIRLLRMGIEFLKDGELYVHRHDAPQLLDIKRGLWSLEQVKTEADRLFKLAEETYIASKLPAQPDRKAINYVCREAIKIALGVWV